MLKKELKRLPLALALRPFYENSYVLTELGPHALCEAKKAAPQLQWQSQMRGGRR